MESDVILKIKDVRYMKDRIIYNYIFKKDVYYSSIQKYYITYGDRFGQLGKYLIIETDSGKKHKICLGILQGFVFIDDFLPYHLSILKKMAPYAKYLRRNTMKDRIKKSFKK